jgi:hypothetical protein
MSEVAGTINRWEGNTKMHFRKRDLIFVETINRCEDNIKMLLRRWDLRVHPTQGRNQ